MKIWGKGTVGGQQDYKKKMGDKRRGKTNNNARKKNRKKNVTKTKIEAHVCCHSNLFLKTTKYS